MPDPYGWPPPDPFRSWLPLFYVLRDGVPVVERDPLAWAEWFEKSDRNIAKDTIGDLLVSTVFLAVDHNPLGKVPILFETMVFYEGRMSSSVECVRCGGSVADALGMHAMVCEAVRAGEILPWSDA